MEKIKFNGDPFEYEYAGRVFYIIKYSRVFANHHTTHLLYGYSKTDSALEYIFLVLDESNNYVLDCLIHSNSFKVLDMYLNSLEIYA